MLPRAKMSVSAVVPSFAFEEGVPVPAQENTRGFHVLRCFALEGADYLKVSQGWWSNDAGGGRAFLVTVCGQSKDGHRTK